MTSAVPGPAARHGAPRAWAWRSGPCRALGHRFEVRSATPGAFAAEFADLVRSFRLPSADDPTGPSGPFARVTRYDIVRSSSEDGLPYALLCDGRRLSGGRVPTDLTGMFTWHLNRSVIDLTVSDRVLLHAAAAVRAGVTVVLPADQESGKSTTVAGLLRAGFDYVTDEAVALDPVTGRVTPYPKHLSLDPGSWSLFPECRPARADWLRQWQVPAAALGARALREPVAPPTVIVFPRYVPGAETALRPVSPGEATRELARMSFRFCDHAGRNLRVLGGLAARATTARLEIGSLPDAVHAIDALVSDRILEER